MIMDLKKKIKAFFTFDRRANDGFTLVELIVVIAILAILGGVAVPAYSGYVTKANKQADITLVSEVAKALSLQYYTNSEGFTGGYVILTTDGATGDGVVGNQAMLNVFGGSWNETAVLKYDGWTDDGLLSYVMENADTAEQVANSTFLTTATPEGLMKAVTGLTDAAATVIRNYNGDVTNTLRGMTSQEFIDKLEATGYKEGDPEYETVISNMLVGHFAETLHDTTYEEIEEVDNGGLLSMVLVYAELFAYCETIDDTTTMDALNGYLADAGNIADLSVAGLQGYLDTYATPDFMTGFRDFALDEDGNPGQGMKDINAALEILGAVDHVADSYTNEELADKNLYASDVVAEQLNNYINAVQAVASGMDVSGLNAGANDIVVFVAQNGAVSVMPSAAYLAG